jgi:ParB-like chromosome segregation protein Spo0J
MRKKGRPAPLHLAARSTGTIAKRDPRVFSMVTRGHVAPGSTGAAAATTKVLDENAITGADAADTPGDASTDKAIDPQGSEAIPQEDVALEFHEYANIFPELTDDRLAELAQDIREHGLLDKIALYEDKILDGRGRYRACRMAAVKLEFEVFTGADPLAYVASRNQHRRDLNPSQRAIVAAQIANFKVGANQHSEGVPIGVASKLMNVSARSAARAREVLAHEDPELVAAVESGDLTVAAAAALARNQATAVSNNPEPSLNSPTASANAPAAEPSLDASTMVEAATMQVGSPSLTDLPLREVTRRPAFELPKPGVTFLVGSLTAAVVEVAVKIGATVSAGDEWPDYSRAERGDVVWLSSQASAQAFLHPQFEAAGAYLQGVRFLEAEANDFGLPIRNLSEDRRRLHREIATKGPVSCVIVDYFAEYLRFGNTGQAIRRFQHATEALQEFAVEHGAAVILPCQLPTRDDHTVTEAVTGFGSLEAVSAVFLVKRAAKP